MTVCLSLLGIFQDPHKLAPHLIKEYLPKTQTQDTLSLYNLENKTYCVFQEVLQNDYTNTHFTHNLAWITEKATAHDAVLMSLSLSLDVFPCRLGTLYPTLEDIQDMYYKNKSHFERFFLAYKGKSEFGLKFWSEAHKKNEGPIKNGRDFFAQKIAQRKAADTHEHMVSTSIQNHLKTLQNAFGPYAQRKILDNPKDQWTLKEHVAFGVDKKTIPQWEKTICNLSLEPNMKIEVTGPWPLYSFAH